MASPETFYSIVSKLDNSNNNGDDDEVCRLLTYWVPSWPTVSLIFTMSHKYGRAHFTAKKTKA